MKQVFTINGQRETQRTIRWRAMHDAAIELIEAGNRPGAQVVRDRIRKEQRAATGVTGTEAIIKELGLKEL